MGLTLQATDERLSAVLRDVWKDGEVNVSEHIKLRKESDQAVAELKGVEGLADQLKNLQLHADELVRACMQLSNAVYDQNIKAQKERDTLSGADGNQQGTDLTSDGEARKNALNDARGALIRAVEYQIAYVVIGAQATVGKLLI